MIHSRRRLSLSICATALAVVVLLLSVSLQTVTGSPDSDDTATHCRARTSHLDQSIAAEQRLVDCTLAYYSNQREHILTVNEARAALLTQQLVTIKTNVRVSHITAEQTRALLAQNRDRLETCVRVAKELSAKRRSLEKLRGELDEEIKREARSNKKRKASLRSLSKAHDKMAKQLLPEAKREYERVRGDLKRAYAELHSTTSDKHFNPADISNRKLDELLDSIHSGDLTIEQFEEQLAKTFPNGLSRVYKTRKKRENGADRVR